MVSKTGCALCCSLLSCFGFVFLLAIGILVKTQPEYMKLSKDVKGTGPLFGSAFLYGTLFVASTTYYYIENKKNDASLARYEAQSTAAERKPLLQNIPEDLE
ncbi:hypothetical protein Poli38472_001216 [Pythium oligandrum]|uniref:Transmembrane protein n=1 Tax=Pythium oligandrum TaxID=41045 RepID=A0A8K1FM78_PYTOL|nr:hypothetical protein Poli38472_001216 [Pythium oligandrum]|eukprot:TMW69060.1 hypothetical protein Poli38472_001216 [Pythium oligandrum]